MFLKDDLVFLICSLICLLRASMNFDISQADIVVRMRKVMDTPRGWCEVCPPWFYPFLDNSWVALTWWGEHVGVENNNKLSLKFCILIESNSQDSFSLLYDGTIDCASLCKLHYCKSQIRRWLSKYVIDFLLVLMIDHCARLKVYLLSLIVQRCNCFSVDAIEC